MKEFWVDFRELTNDVSLSKALGAPPSLIEQLSKENDQLVFYKVHRIPKRRVSAGESFRIAYEPRSDEVKQLFSTFLRRFELFAKKNLEYPHLSAHGYIQGRSILSNAKKHAGRKVLLSADIKNFFPSISRERVQQFLIGVANLNPSVAKTLSTILTINGSLALGLSSSPLIANLICKNLDSNLSNLAKRTGSVYTRFADDLFFSGETLQNVPSHLEISQELKREGFTLSEKKFKIKKNGQAFFATGLAVSDSIPRIPKRIKRRIRQELFYAKKFGISEHKRRTKAPSFVSDVNHFEGYLRFMHSIERGLAEHFKEEWDAIWEKESPKWIFSPDFQREPKKICFYIDETLVEIKGKSVLALGVVQIDDHPFFDESISNLLSAHIENPFSSGRKGKLKDKGLHFTDSSEEIRTDFLRTFCIWPFKAFVAYDYCIEAEYSDKYRQLFKFLITQRFTAADQCIVRFIIEQNSKVVFANLHEEIESRYMALSQKGAKRPLQMPLVINGKKQDYPTISLVDFVLGVFQQYMKASLDPSEGTALETVQKRFESIRDRIRFIFSFISNAKYSRRNLFLLNSIQEL